MNEIIDKTDKPLFNIHINSTYLEDDSEPQECRYLFAYNIAFENLTNHSIQLTNSYWTITNSEGVEQPFYNDKIDGEKPIISANSGFQYTRGILLDTPVGTMHGYYEIIDGQGELLRIDVPAFRLAITSLIH